ncbi:MAG TPA: sigma-70 family RNA polymerase sigma factor [Candidatus Polarisedimenticolaceae bacterium]|nr:sigma-70 family RNA polymerase sigma factor [Candidatus Polarisedimenticolaceae bacterium]
MSDLASDTSIRLLRLYRGGDAHALSDLVARHRPAMARWAHGRLPHWARGAIDTEDLVQDVLIKTVTHLDVFQPRHDGALQAYLRQAVLNRIQDEVRKVHRRGQPASLDSQAPGAGPTPQEEAEAQELLESYEQALSRLKDEDREAIIARVELKLPFKEVARMLGKPSEEAAQMAVSRALVRLAREMGRER